MRRSLALLGFATLIVAACHTNGPGGDDMPPPMMYTAAPAATASPATPSACGSELPTPVCSPAQSR